MPRNSLLLFVYGTLRRGCASGAHKQYLTGAKFISMAKTRGSLFLVDYYPGLCVGKNTDAWVAGEIYLLNNRQQLQQLDGYEGCASDSPQPYEYTRSIIDALLPEGKIAQVWTYTYNGDTTAAKQIMSGDFLQP